MHAVQCLPCSISLSKGSMQWREWKAKLGSSRIQASKASVSTARSSMGPEAAQLPTESPAQESQQHQSPSEDQQPMCAATAMMHGIPSGAANSWQGAACPPIHEHRQWAPQATEDDVILPNSGYRVDANIWHLNIMDRALRPGPMASFLRHCNSEPSRSKLSLWWSSAGC